VGYIPAINGIMRVSVELGHHRRRHICIFGRKWGIEDGWWWGRIRTSPSQQRPISHPPVRPVWYNTSEVRIKEAAAACHPIPIIHYYDRRPLPVIVVTLAESSDGALYKPSLPSSFSSLSPLRSSHKEEEEEEEESIRDSTVTVSYQIPIKRSPIMNSFRVSLLDSCGVFEFLARVRGELESDPIFLG